jgi:hypothetical protein
MAYIGNSPGNASSRVVTRKTATAGQTSFASDSGYATGYVDVLVNGIDIVEGVDFTATDGINIVLSEACAGGEEIKIIAWIPRGLSDGYLKSEANVLLAAKADLVNGLVPSSQLPSYVDDVLEYTNYASFPATGEAGKIYVDKSAVNKAYRWSGSAYILITDLSAYYTASQVDTALAAKQNSLGYTPVNKAGDQHTGVHRFNSYFAIGKGASNQDQITWNAVPDNNGNYTPHWAGSSDAGGVIMGLPYGGGGGLEVRSLRHGTSGGSKVLADYPVRLSMTDGGYFTMPYQPAFAVANPRNANYYLVDSTLYTLDQWATGHVNRGNHFNYTTGYFTAPVAGVYQFNVSIMWRCTSTATYINDLTFGLYKNNSLYVQTDDGVGDTAYDDGWRQTSFSYCLQLDTNDTVSVKAMASTSIASGVTTDVYIYGSGSYTFFSGHLIG